MTKARVTAKRVREQLERFDVLRRWVDGDDPEAIARDLGISRRRFLRVVRAALTDELDEAVRALAEPAAKRLVQSVDKLAGAAVKISSGKCSVCAGNGTVADDLCGHCQGSGRQHDAAERIAAIDSFMDALSYEPEALIQVAALQKAMHVVSEEHQSLLEREIEISEKAAAARGKLLESEETLEEFLLESLQLAPLSQARCRYPALQRRLHDAWINEVTARLREQRYLVIPETRVPDSWPRRSRVAVGPKDTLEAARPSSGTPEAPAPEEESEWSGDWRAGGAWGPSDFAPRGDPYA